MNDTFKKIYENESDAIFRFCLVRVSDREEALDITQETFLRLWKSLRDEQNILNSRAFLFTVARRLIIDWYRKKKSLSLEKMLEGESSYDIVDDNTVEDSNFSLSEGRYLLSGINELNPSYRDPVYLRFVEGLSPPEIAEILGLSTSATSVRINRGLAELRKKRGYADDIKE